MAYPVGVGVFNVLADPIRPGMNGFAGKRVPRELEAITLFIETGRIGEKMLGDRPQLGIESVEQAAALDADFLDDLLVEVVEQFSRASF